MANAVLENNMGAEALKRKETLNYQIRTEGFEKILLAMQHITQRIKKGEKCVATIEYDPDELFTRITTVSDRPGMESAQEKAEEAFHVIVERIAAKYAGLVEKHIDNAQDGITGNNFHEIREDIRMLAHITATMQRLFHMGNAVLGNGGAKKIHSITDKKNIRYIKPSIVINKDAELSHGELSEILEQEFEKMMNSYCGEEAFRTKQSDGPTLKSRKQECIKMAMGLGIPLDYVLENYDYLSKIRIDGAKISDSYTKEGGMDLNGNCKTIAEYAFRSWMETNGFVNKYFTLEVVGNEAVIKDRTGDTLNLVYDSAEKCVRVSE